MYSAVMVIKVSSWKSIVIILIVLYKYVDKIVSTGFVFASTITYMY